MPFNGRHWPVCLLPLSVLFVRLVKLPLSGGRTYIMMWLYKVWNMCCRCGHLGYLCIARALIWVNQITAIAPIGYVTASLLDGSTAGIGYHSKRYITVMACAHLLVLALLAPFVVKYTIAFYYWTNKQAQDDLFNTIALVVMIVDVIIILIILCIQIVKRCKLAIFLNSLVDVVKKLQQYSKDFIGPQFFVFLLLKLAYKLYTLFVNIPLLVKRSSEIETRNLLAMVGILYVQLLLAIFAVDIFAILLFLNACYEWLQQRYKEALKIQKLPQLMELNGFEKDFRVIIQLFTSNFQIGLALVLLVDFVNLLASLYAVAYYALADGNQNYSFVAYATTMAIDYYASILAAHLCFVKQRNIKDVLLNRECPQKLEVSEECEKL